MYLKEVENRPAQGMTKLAFQSLEGSGEAVPEILHLFRFKPGSTNHLVKFTEQVMRGPSPLSEGLRELIGAYLSKRNQCSFCSDSHAEAAAQYLGKSLVDQVLADIENSPLDAAHKQLFRYIDKLAENPARVTESDIQKLRACGWTEEAIYDALTVVSVFKFYNTWNNGSGVKPMTSADYAYSGKVLKTIGYCMDFKFTRLLKLGLSQWIELLKPVFFPIRRKQTEPSRAWAKSQTAI